MKQTRAIFDYEPGQGWSGRATAPADWDWAGSGFGSSDEATSAAGAAAALKYGADTSTWMDYTGAGWAQALIEDELDPNNPHRNDECPLCNPEHPDHERALAAAQAAERSNQN